MKRIEKYFNISEEADISSILDDASIYLGIHEDGRFIWCRYGADRCNHCIFSKYEDCEEEVYNYFNEEIEE